MQDLQNVHLNPTEIAGTQSDLAKAAQEENLRKRKNHAGGADGVQFSTIFSMVDSSLEAGQETLRKLPKRQATKESDSDKPNDLVLGAPVDTKIQAADAPKETAKSKVDTVDKVKPVKETAAKKVDPTDGAFVQIMALQAKVDIRIHQADKPVERTEIRIERQDTRVIDKVRTQEKVEHRSETKDHAPQTAEKSTGSNARERVETDDQAKNQDRRVREKRRDHEDNRSDQIREDQRPSDSQKSARAEEDAAGHSKGRERPSEKPADTLADSRDLKPSEKKVDDLNSSDRKRTDEQGQADSSSKKRVGDLEKLTGLSAKSVMELAPMVVPVQDFGIKLNAEATSKVISIDSVRSPAKAVPAPASSGSQQNGQGAGAQERAAQAQEKLGQSAERLKSYLSGKLDSLLKPETTFTDLVAKAKLFMDAGKSEMTIQLRPEHLGSLNIKITVEDKDMQAHFVTDRAEVKDLIEKHADILKDKLAEAGINVGTLSVEVRSDAGSTQLQDSGSSGLRKVTEFGGSDSGDGNGTGGAGSAQIAYLLAGMGTQLSLVA